MANNPVIKTLLYESIFNSSFGKEELWKFLISEKQISRVEFEDFLKDPKIKLNKNGKYYLGNKKTQERKTNGTKLQKAINAAQILSVIPSVNFIGISGSLALNTASENDDIDFFVITKSNTIWTTRLFCVILMKALGLYRQDRNFKNKICLNMFISRLDFKKDRQDLYNAFEISQIYPLVDKKNTYKEFISANSWIDKYLPNARGQNNMQRIKNIKNNFALKTLFRLILFLGFEQFAKFAQLLLMKKRTLETVSSELLAFHPIDFREQILTKYEILLKDY